MDVRKQVTRSVGAAAVALAMTPIGAWAQSGPHPIRFSAQLDGAQSVAINSTALETRTGTGTASIVFDPVSGDLSYDISFQGLIAEDITLGDPAINPDGTPTPPGTINGNALPGGGLFLLHFHVGAPGANGPIPVDIVAQTGPAVGVLTTDPTPIQTAATGRVTGMVNIFDLAVDGFLLNGVPVDGRDDGIRDPDCVQCGLVEAFLSNNVYVNIHTFNNPFGEIRGQALAVGCTTFVNTIEGLRTAVADAVTRKRTLRSLDLRLRLIDRDLNDGDTDRARRGLGDFIEEVTDLSARRRGRDAIAEDAANDLVCAASNILTTAVTPVVDPAPADPAPVDPAPEDPAPADPEDPAPVDPPASDEGDDMEPEAAMP